MLPQRLRLRKSADFGPVMKHGYRVTRPTLVLYARTSDAARFGLVVGKAVGGAVVRNRVKRQLRHCAYGLIDESRPLDVVVRALAPAGGPAASLRHDMESAWNQAKGVVLA